MIVRARKEYECDGANWEFYCIRGIHKGERYTKRVLHHETFRLCQSCANLSKPPEEEA